MKNNTKKTIVFLIALVMGTFVLSQYTFAQSYSGFYVTCNPSAATINIGQSVTWTASVSGVSSYSIDWLGDDNLIGTGSTVTKTYNNSGYKYAYIRVRSGSRTEYGTCSSPVYVRTSACSTGTCGTGGYTGSTGATTNITNNIDNTVNTNTNINVNNSNLNNSPIVATIPATNINNNINTDPYYSIPSHSSVYYYTPPSYTLPIQTNYNYTAPISGTCRANTSSAYVGSTVSWTVNAIGGTGSYTYSWAGTDGLHGTNAVASINYPSTGNKSAYVTVYSGNQSKAIFCSNVVNVYSLSAYSAPQVIYPVQSYNPYIIGTDNNASGLDVGCYVDPISVTINQPATWNVEVAGGIAPYRYVWSGSDGLVGTNSSIVKYYSTTGTKSAVVTVTSADGRTVSKACTNTLAVRGLGTATATSTNGNMVTSTSTATSTDIEGLGATAVLSFGNVPWGWIAIIIILILFGIVLYLLFNRHKI